jgi:hypothetical protein
MCIHHTMLSLLACALTLASALPHSEAATTTKLTKTAVVTVTHTIHHPLRSTTLPADPTLECPSTNEPCIIDGIAIWPSGTTRIIHSSTINPNASSFFSAAFFSSSSPGKPPTSTTSAHSTPSTSASLLANESDWIYSVQPTAPPTQASSEPVSAASHATSFLEPIAWSGMDGALVSRARRAEENGVHKGRRSIWYGFFAGANAQQIVRDKDEVFETDVAESQECCMCEKGRSLVCINGTHFGYCDEGCAEPRELREGMKCVEGKIYGAKLYRG